MSIPSTSTLCQMAELRSNTVPSLKDLCLETLAVTKYRNPETNIPFENIPSHIINDLFNTLMSVSRENVVYIKSVNFGFSTRIAVPHDMKVKQIREIVRQQQKYTFPSEVGLIFAGRELEDSKTLCQYGISGGTNNRPFWIHATSHASREALQD